MVAELLSSCGFRIALRSPSSSSFSLLVVAVVVGFEGVATRVAMLKSRLASSCEAGAVVEEGLEAGAGIAEEPLLL